MTEIEMVIDSIRVSLMNYQRVIILKEKKGERYLPIWVGAAEADSIAVKMQNVSVPRPLTHDFVRRVIDTLGATVKSSIISELKKDTFYAKVVLDVNNERREIDCRPSDALAIAIRTGTPIFANEKVLGKVAIFMDEEGRPTEVPSGSISSELAKEPSALETFSTEAQDILNLSEQEAKRLNSNFVSTGHLLLALVKKTPTLAYEALSNLSLNLAKAVAEIEASIKQQPNIESGETGLSSAVKKVIRLSVNEKNRLGAGRVQPEHILIGLIRQDEGIATNFFKNLGINAERIYIELIRLYTQSWYEQQPPSN